MSDTENTLETLLAQAATEPAWRPAFFNALMAASVIVPGSESEAPQAGGELVLEHWETADGSSVIPFFTSVEALREAVAEETPFLVLPARELFTVTQGETLFLNARLPTGKAFSPVEIERLLAGGSSALSEQTVREGQDTLLLSQVADAELPAQMIASLTTLLGSLKTVKRAWICRLKEAADQNGNWLIGLEMTGNDNEVIQAVGNVATDTLPDDEPIDICPIHDGEPGISHFMVSHLTPFYERRWGSFLRDYKSQRII